MSYFHDKEADLGAEADLCRRDSEQSSSRAEWEGLFCGLWGLSN